MELLIILVWQERHKKGQASTVGRINVQTLPGTTVVLSICFYCRF